MEKLFFILLIIPKKQNCFQNSIKKRNKNKTIEDLIIKPHI